MYDRESFCLFRDRVRCIASLAGPIILGKAEQGLSIFRKNSMSEPG